MNFRIKLLAAMMLVISAITGLGLYYAQRNAKAGVEQQLQREFQAELAALHSVQDIRHAALAERCRALVSKPRIHAALEDDALDLLYPSARDELRDVMEASGDESPTRTLQARFYRFLDAKGQVISPPQGMDVGQLSAEEESALDLPKLPEQQQLGYLRRHSGEVEETVDEVIAMPIISTESHEAIAALVVGFKPAVALQRRGDTGIKSGIWLDRQLHLPSLPEAMERSVGEEVTRAIADPAQGGKSFAVSVDRAPYLLFYKELNPGSLFPRAYEVSLYPLAEFVARQQQLRWRILGAGAVLLLGGLVASHFASGQLAAPVRQLEVTSEENRTQRQRAEAALESTSEELQRSARFAADASHQLKTPVTVLRAGLEELRARENLTPEELDEISALIHQTYRLTGIIEDLLLLARMEAGRVRLEFAPVNLSQIIDGWLDDLSTLPDTFDLTVETDCPSGLHISGEKRYTTLIVQNLLVNARKYNRVGGAIRVSAREDGEWVVLSIGNSGKPIPEAVQERIFERFHRGTAGENVPGHGLGLNLARELARIHGGDLRLKRSEDDWTEFEVRFRLASQPSVSAHEGA